jgi:hypothetical protein
MTVLISKPSINLREAIKKSPSGIAGEAVLRSDTEAEAREALSLDNHETLTVSTDGVIADFESTGIDDNATSTKLTVSNTGIDVTGTVTADGLTVAGEGAFAKNQAADTAVEVSNLGTPGATTTASFILSESAGTPKGWFRRYRDGTATTAVGFSDKLVFEGAIGSTPTNRMEIASNGDISFYEDTGTTPKFFWDASAEALGIGTSSPVNELEVYGAGSPRLAIRAPESIGESIELGFQFGTAANSSANTLALIRAIPTQVDPSPLKGDLAFFTNVGDSAVERLRITSDGKFGVGTGSPVANLTVGGLPVSENGSTSYGSTLIRGEDYSISNTQRGILDIEMSSVTAQDAGATLTFTNNVSFFGTGNDFVAAGLKAAKENATNANQSSYLAFYTNGSGTVSERLRIDSSGNVGIGTSSPGNLLHVSGSGDVADFETSSVGGVTFSRTNNVGNGSVHFGVGFLNADSTVANISTINRTGGTTSTGTGYELRTSVAGTGYLSYYTNGSEAMRIDDSGNIGIGTSSPDTKLDLFLGTTTSGDYITAGNTNRFGNGLNKLAVFKHGYNSPQEVASIAVNTVSNAPNLDGRGDLLFYTGTSGASDGGSTSAERMRIDFNGNVGIGTSSPGQKLEVNGNIIADGIYLGGTAAANLLDDYEEGTFTPVLADASSGGNASSTTLFGAYTKVGNLVYVSIIGTNVDLTGMTSGNDAFITGLPFTLVSSAGRNPPSFVWANQFTYSGTLGFESFNNTSYGKFPIISSASNVSYVTIADIGDGTADFKVSFCYQAA